jgi:hypothetical protein
MSTLLKNGWPWSSITKLNVKPSERLLEDAISKWKSIDWGEDFENNVMASNVTAINDCKRSVSWIPGLSKNADTIRDIAYRMFVELQPCFPEKMQLTTAALCLLLPHGKLLWHHDGLSQYKHGTRIMLPLLNTDNINYHFTSWREDTPTDDYFDATLYRDNDEVIKHMEQGQYYIFNHRVPHKVESYSDKPRAMLHIDIMPASINFKDISGKFAPITEFERTKILD